jgi:hypothetical protein
MDKAWAGVDVGKGFHWAHVLDVSGRELLSRRVENEEADILRLIDEALSFTEEVHWAVDQPGGGAALLLALLWEHDQKVLYVPVDLRRFRGLFETENSARKGEHCHEQTRPTHRSFAEKLSGWLELPMRSIPFLGSLARSVSPMAPFGTG